MKCAKLVSLFFLSVLMGAPASAFADATPGLMRIRQILKRLDLGTKILRGHSESGECSLRVSANQPNDPTQIHLDLNMGDGAQSYSLVLRAETLFESFELNDESLAFRAMDGGMDGEKSVLVHSTVEVKFENGLASSYRYHVALDEGGIVPPRRVMGECLELQVEED